MRLFVHRIFAFRPHKPRHPLVKLAAGLLGVALLALLVVFGLFIGIGMLLFATVRRIMRPQPARPQAGPEMVIEGEYSVVRQSQHLLNTN